MFKTHLMKYLFSLALFLTLLTSCTSMMISHRMKAAQRKLLETRSLEQTGQWPEALAMSEKLHGSVKDCPALFHVLGSAWRAQCHQFRSVQQF